MKLSSDSGPFLWIDDARAEPARPARLYRNPVAVVEAWRLDTVVPALRQLREAREAGLHAAGFISYEAGYALEPRLAGSGEGWLENMAAPLLWFGLFPDYETLTAQEVLDRLETGEGRLGSAVPEIADDQYAKMFASVQDHIVAGDVYQVNLTFPCSVAVEGDPIACYRDVRARAGAGHGALLFTGAQWLLSFSPELFFQLESGELTTRPMKGTALRDREPQRDVEQARALADDPKQRAENLMIVDLLRNDLSRVSVAGTVSVPDLFTVESYPTVHQMTSTVTGRLAPGYDAIDALMALFPCGSITGAPKIRAMEMIRDVEVAPRGPYTGSIGTLDANGDAAFNVAIRTVSVKYGATQGVIGLGSGLVADSTEMSEWHECLDKGRFLSK